jgi:hypothetical protein
MFYLKKIKLNNKGQSLAEILVALAVGIIFVLGAMIVAQSSLKIGKDTEKIQISAFLARELLDKIKVFADSDWHNISNLATTSANHYYLISNLATTSANHYYLIGFTATSGDETITIGTTTYKRYFYVDDVYRDSGGKISPTGNFDPSTKKITIGVGWSGAQDRFFITYITRSKNNIFLQTDWSGGGGQLGPITSTNNKFDTSTPNIDFSTTTGSIRLKLGY